MRFFRNVTCPRFIPCAVVSDPFREGEAPAEPYSLGRMMDSRVVLEKTPLGATGCTQPVWRKLSPEHGLSTTRGTQTRWSSVWDSSHHPGIHLEPSLNVLARFREGEPPGEPSVLSARPEPRPPRITQDDFGSSA